MQSLFTIWKLNNYGFSTIITSNLAFTEWGDAFPNKLLGAATLDRLAHAAYKVVLEGKSYRSDGASTKKTHKKES